MADELLGVRRRFVNKVSNVVISQLLDDLLEDKVMNDEERDSIVKRDIIPADRARQLIDAVRKKGDRASRRMMAHLQTRDPTLHSELFRSCAAEPQVDEDMASTLNPVTEDFWRKKQKDENVYRVTRKNLKNRVALLITNIKFTQEDLNRKGAEKDEENTEKLLADLGYEVVKHTNLTAKAIDQALVDFSAHPKLKDTDSVLVVIMSHGKLGAILGVDWKPTVFGDEKPDEFPIDNFYQHLGSEKCPALLNKPKILIIQACRGEKGGSVLVHNAPEFYGDGAIEQDNYLWQHKEKDFTSLLSCTPDTVSYRDKYQGAIFIQFLVDIFNTYAHKDDVGELFRKVMRRFEEFTHGNKRQMPTRDRCTLTKCFYFFPGLSAD